MARRRMGWGSEGGGEGVCVTGTLPPLCLLCPSSSPSAYPSFRKSGRTDARAGGHRERERGRDLYVLHRQEHIQGRRAWAQAALIWNQTAGRQAAVPLSLSLSLSHSLSQCRDALSKTLYSRLFDNVVKCVNSALRLKHAAAGQTMQAQPPPSITTNPPPPLPTALPARETVYVYMALRT